MVEFQSPEELKAQRDTREAEQKEQLELSRQLSPFIWDENGVVKRQIFPFLKINHSSIAIGVFLPKIIDVISKKGKKLFTQQIEKACLITSDGKLLEADERQLEESHKIRIEGIPLTMPRRYSLNTINQFLRGKAPNVYGLALYEKIKAAYEDYLTFSSPEWYKIHALWDIGTYFFLLFDAYPLLELRGIKGSAKSKTMNLSRQISFNSTQLMTNPSEATLFRICETKPVKYIDEAEKLFWVNRGRVENDSRAEIINSSNHKSGCVPRQEKQGEKFVTKWYSTYSPCMIGSINGTFGATEDRAIIHVTIRNPAGDDRGDRDINEDSEAWQEIRDELFLYCLQNWQGIEETYQLLQNDTNFRNREFTQIWKPILALAKYISGPLYEEVRSFAEKLAEVKSIDGLQEGSLDYDILKTAQGILESGEERLYIKRIAELYPGEHKQTNQKIGRYMDKLGFRDLKRRANDGTYYDVSLQKFEEIVKPICSSLFSSPSSLSSLSYTKLQNYSEESVKESEANEATKQPKSEESEANEGK